MLAIKSGLFQRHFIILNTKNNISQNNKDEQNYYFECARKNLKPKIN